MIWPTDSTIHGDDYPLPSKISTFSPNPTRFGDKGYQYCSYCGSIRPEDFFKLLEEDSCCEAADQKYGYIHKIYMKDNVKFYTRHLFDIQDQETLKTVLEKLAEVGRIKLVLRKP